MLNRTVSKTVTALTLAAGLAAAGSASSGDVEVLHWWTSGGEAAAVGELKGMLEAQGHTWEDFAVAGGGGEAAMTALKSRVLQGDPPAAAQMKGPQIQQWGDTGELADLTPVAEQQGWDELMPSVVSDIMKYDGRYVAAPVNVHRVNWMWVNPGVFEEAGAEIPSTWDEFVTAAETIEETGQIAVAHGATPWQTVTVFESLVLGVGGADLYRQAFVEHDPEALTSDDMVEALRRLKVFKDFTDDSASGRAWNRATRMVMDGQAAMQFMGDWAKGEFSAADKVAGEDYVCRAVPGTGSTFTFNIDSFAMFQVSEENRSAQLAMARTIMGEDFQALFNQAKGSIPVRPDMSMTDFDECAQNSMRDFRASEEGSSLVPSMAHGMSTFPAIKGAIFDTVTNYYNSDMTPERAAEELADTVAAAEPSF